jgi:C4-type Zn-finger protein
VAGKIRLACPCCGSDGDWTVPATGQTWWAPGGREVPVITGVCSRCRSRVALEPSHDAVEIIRDRETKRASAKVALARMAKVTGDG